MHSVIEFILNYNVMLGGTTSNFFSLFFHGNVWHHFNNNKTWGEWVLMWLLHVYPILVENILLFTHSQKLLTIGVYWKRKNKFLLRMWFLVRWPWSRGWLIPMNLWRTQIKLRQLWKWAFGWRGTLERGTSKQNVEPEEVHLAILLLEKKKCVNRWKMKPNIKSVTSK